MSTFEDRILELLKEPPSPVRADDLGRSEAVFVHLVEAARGEAIADAPPDLRAWVEGMEDDDRAAREVERSMVAAEVLEGLIDRLPTTAADGTERLAAAGTGADARDAAGAAARAPFPATYTGGGWRVTLGVEEQGRLYAAVDAAPAGSGEARLRLEGVDFTIPAGPPALIGDPLDVIGAPAEFNPWSVVTVETDEGDVVLERTP